jgi:sugar phosphate isomerase/epimerase
MFRALAEHVVHAHFVDLVEHLPGREAGRRAMDGNAYTGCVLGEGAVDFPALIRAMRARGYDGTVEIEYQGNEYDAEEGIRRSLEYLRGVEVATGD